MCGRRQLGGMSMKKRERAIVIVFIAILFTCSGITLFLPDKAYSVEENRELAQVPKLTKKKILKGSYQKQYETYLSDQFFLRDKWVTLYANMQVLLGKREINGVYIGKEGYLLEKMEEKEFDADQVQENVETLASFLNDAAAAYGPEHVSCMMIPSKTRVMWDKLPAFVEAPGEDGVLESLRQKLTDTAILWDMFELLQRHRGEYIYYRSDHHWTTLGAYYAYAAWAGRASDTGHNSREMDIGRYRRESIFTDFYGTTYNKVHIKVPEDTVELFHGPGEEGVRLEMDDDGRIYDSMYFSEEAAEGFDRYRVFFSKNTFKIKVDTRTGTGKTLLLIKDSFANCFVPFLTEDYDRILMIDYRYGKTPVGKIMSENEDITDVLVLFNTEKFMENRKLGKLADTRRKSQTMQEFNMEDLME